MTEFPPLASLGRRIMILGPTNAGKSTLAEAISTKTGIPAVHLDQLRHLPGTNWVERDDDAFKELHDAAAAKDAWIMDGGYSKLMAPRLARVTGMIVLSDSLSVRMRRYFWRSLFQSRRAGGLDGQQDSVRWKMIHWLWHTRNAAVKYRRMAAESGLPHVFVRDEGELNALYAGWDLVPFPGRHPRA